MDKYRKLFEKGSNEYINQLRKINWFDNPYLNEEKIIDEIKNTYSPPYFVNSLIQVGYLVEFYGNTQLNHILECLQSTLPNLKYSIEEDGLNLKIKNYNDYLKVDIENFELGEGEDSFVQMHINPFLTRAGIAYNFFELPPGDETASLVFVKEETYQKAIEIGIIPDFLGYFVMNDFD